MKNITIFLLFTLLSHFLPAQNFCNIGGAQCGELGLPDCHPYESPCPEESDAKILLLLETDLNAEEISWQVMDMTDSILIASGDSLVGDTVYRHLICAQKDHCYTFLIYDSSDNGLYPDPGKYSLFWNGDTVGIGSDIELLDTVEIGACCTNFGAELSGGITCMSNSYGQVFAETLGGTGPYTFDWSTGASHTTVQSIDSLDTSVSVIVTDGSGCTAEDTLDISEFEMLDVSIIPQAVSTIGDSDGSLLAVPQGGIPPYSYLWSTGATTSGIYNLAAGLYTVTISGFSGCTVVDTIELVECDNCIESGFSVDESVLCFGSGTVHFTNPCPVGLEYLWDFGDGSTSTEHEPSHEYYQPGTFDVTLIASDPSIGCTDTLIIPDLITVDPLIEASALITNYNCITGEGGSIYVDVNGGTPPYFYSWNVDSMIIIGPIAENLLPGFYEVSITDYMGCTLVLPTSVELEGQIEEMETVSICQGDSIFLAGEWQTEEGEYLDYYSTPIGCDSIVYTTLSFFSTEIPEIEFVNDSLISSPGVTYQWYFEGQAIPGATDQFYIPTESGEYIVVVTDSNGCTAQSEPFIFTSDGQVGLALDKWKVWPNPTNSILHISFESDQDLKEVSLSIVDLLGRIHFLHHEPEFNGRFYQVLDLSDKAGGIYYIRLKTDKGIVTEKVILTN